MTVLESLSFYLLDKEGDDEVRTRRMAVLVSVFDMGGFSTPYNPFHNPLYNPFIISFISPYLFHYWVTKKNAVCNNSISSKCPITIIN